MDLIDDSYVKLPFQKQSEHLKMFWYIVPLNFPLKCKPYWCAVENKCKQDSVF